MKTLVIAASAAAALAIAAPAFADSPTYDGTTYYGDLGYSNLSASGGEPDFSAVTGRLGARFGKYLGLEGELSAGVNSQHVDIGGVSGNLGMNQQYAVYGVGYLPVTPNADLLARIGYGATDFHTSVPNEPYRGQDNSWNLGVGGQYFFDSHNGVRADYTRSDYERGPDGNTWALAFVRKF